MRYPIDHCRLKFQSCRQNICWIFCFFIEFVVVLSFFKDFFFITYTEQCTLGLSILSDPLSTSQIFYTVIYFTVVESRLTIISSGIKITKFNSLFITPLTQIQCLNVRFSEHYPTVKGCDHSFTRLSELLSLTVGKKLQIWRCPFLP